MAYLVSYGKLLFVINNQRFQKAKYRRQLYRMSQELKVWRLLYLEAQRDHPDDWLGRRFAERYAQVDEMIHLLLEVSASLERIT